jgi:hypothetical protein
MSEVTVFGRDGENFTALADPVFIIKIPVIGGDDKYIVTKAIWGYQNSTDPETNAGWQGIKDMFDLAAQSSSNQFSAVTIVDRAVAEVLVRSSPPAPL